MYSKLFQSVSKRTANPEKLMVGEKTHRKIKLSILGFFGAGTYLTYDFYNYQKNEDAPIKIKKVYFFSDTLFQVTKFSSDELLKKQLLIRDGLAYRSDLNTPLDGNDWIYVMQGDGRIFIEHQKRRITNHASLGSAFKIMAAGEITFKAGKVYELNENSGHYRPRNRVHLMELKLKELGIQFHPDYECKNYLSRPMIQSR